MRLFATICYNDGKQQGYKGIKLSNPMGKIQGGVSILFNSGRPVVDYIEYMRYISEEENGVSSVGWSSSLDHFMMDGDRFKSAYVKLKKKPEKSKFILLEDAQKLDDIERYHKITNKWSEYIVNRYIKSFADLKRYFRRYRIKPSKGKPYIVFQTKKEETAAIYDA